MQNEAIRAEIAAKIQQDPSKLERILASISDENVKQKIISLFGQGSETGEPGPNDIDDITSDDGIDYNALSRQINDEPMAPNPHSTTDKWKMEAIDFIAGAISEDDMPAAPEAPPAPTKPKPQEKPNTTPKKPTQPWKQPFKVPRPHTEPGPMNKRK